jgi:hypothetical protein
MKPESLKLRCLLLTITVLSGCASSGPPLPPSLEVPSPVTDLRALRKGDKVYLAWTEPTKTTDHQTIRDAGPTLICRSRENAMNACGRAVGAAPPAARKRISSKKQAPLPKTTATYEDILPVVPGVRPDDVVTYAVDVLNDRNRGAGLSNQVQLPLLPAVPPPVEFQAEVTGQGVKLIWASASSPPQFANVEYRLRVYRRQEGSQSDDKIAEPVITDWQRSNVLDTTFEWEKTYNYRAAVLTVISPPGKPAMEIEGDDTASVRVLAHDTFPPAVPSGLQADFSGPGQPLFVDLIWSPDTEADLAGYNVYRRDENGQAAKLNSELVAGPAYRDDKVQSGKNYFYSVSAVDMRGNESAKSEETSETVP